MRKFDRVLERLDALERCFRDHTRVEPNMYGELKKQENMIRTLTAENATLKRDNEVLFAALALKGDTKCIMYKGRRYMVEDIAAYESQSEGEIDSVEMRCFAIE